MIVLTTAERVFLERMVPHLDAGMSFDEAAAAVLADDQRIAEAVLDHSYSQRESDERSSIRSEISAEVYRRIRAS